MSASGTRPHRPEFPQYRLLFPFESHSLTDRLWWEIDHTRSCWRTIGWDVNDPNYNERAVARARGNSKEEEDSGLESAGESDDNNENIVTEFEALNVKAAGERKKKELFDSCYVTNDIETAQSIIDRSKHQEVLINEATISGGPIPLAACEEGHLPFLVMPYFPLGNLEDLHSESPIAVEETI